MREPSVHAQAFFGSAHRGYHFVEYTDGEISGLMDKATARNYANIFGGEVRLHSEAPFRVRHAGKLRIFMLASCLILLATAALADEFKPLTRDEPIVRMVLQEAVSEPLAGQVAVAGVALDRMSDPRWPSTAKDVIYQPWQFTGMRAKLRDYTREEIEEARLAVELARSGTRPCGNVLWYHTTEVSPAWANNVQVSCQIGDHIFYIDKETT